MVFNMALTIILELVTLWSQHDLDLDLRQIARLWSQHSLVLALRQLAELWSCIIMKTMILDRQLDYGPAQKPRLLYCTVSGTIVQDKLNSNSDNLHEVSSLVFKFVVH